MSRKKGSLGRVASSRGMVPVTKQVSAISGSEESRARTVSIRSGLRSSMRSRFRATCHMNLITSFGAANSKPAAAARSRGTRSRRSISVRASGMTAAGGRERRDRDDGNRIAQGLLQEPPEHRDQPVREVVEAPEAREAEEARNEDHDIGRLHRQSLPQAATSASGLPDASSAGGLQCLGDRKSTRLNSSHLVISYAVFC